MFRMKLTTEFAMRNPQWSICISLETPCRGARAKGNEKERRKGETRKRIVAVRDPRESAILGPGGLPSICCSYCFRHKYLPRMYWVLSPHAFYFLSTMHITGRLFPIRYFAKVMRKRIS